MFRKKGKLFAVLAVLVIAGIYYYATIPAFNIHSGGFWTFIIGLMILALLVYGVRRVHTVEELKTNKIVKFGIFAVLLVVGFTEQEPFYPPLLSMPINIRSS